MQDNRSDQWSSVCVLITGPDCFSETLAFEVAALTAEVLCCFQSHLNVLIVRLGPSTAQATE